MVDSQGLDHDDGIEGALVERLFVLRRKGQHLDGTPLYISAQAQKDKNASQLQVLAPPLAYVIRMCKNYAVSYKKCWLRDMLSTILFHFIKILLGMRLHAFACQRSVLDNNIALKVYCMNHSSCVPGRLDVWRSACLGASSSRPDRSRRLDTSTHRDSTYLGEMCPTLLYGIIVWRAVRHVHWTTGGDGGLTIPQQAVREHRRIRGAVHST